MLGQRCTAERRLRRLDLLNCDVQRGFSIVNRLFGMRDFLGGKGVVVAQRRAPRQIILFFYDAPPALIQTRSLLDGVRVLPVERRDKGAETCLCLS